jgi:hypothetical protein
MAIVKNNILLQFISGTLADQFTIYERNGVIIMAAKRGPSTKPPTKKQKEARWKMKVAVAYAQSAMMDPELKAAYQAKAGRGQNAFNMAVRDAYSSPEIQNIQIEEEQITVKATDDFQVANVHVHIKDENGKVVEQGKATLSPNRTTWVYKFSSLPKGGKVAVIVEDLPGNSVKEEVLIPDPGQKIQ